MSIFFKTTSVILFLFTTVSYGGQICALLDSDAKKVGSSLLYKGDFFTGIDLCIDPLSKKKIIEREYVDGELKGLATEWHANGRKKSETYYKDGKKNGRATDWHMNGQKKHTFLYVNDQEKERISYKDGKKDTLSRGSTKVNYKNGYKNTQITEWNKWTVDRGEVRHEYHTLWRDNGHKKKAVKYENGKKHGKTVYWNKDGQKQKEVNYNGGKKHGKTVCWYKNGQVKGEVKYEFGNKHRRSTYWYEDGQKQKRINYYQGVIVREWEWTNQKEKSKSANTASHVELNMPNQSSATDSLKSVNTEYTSFNGDTYTCVDVGDTNFDGRPILSCDLVGDSK